MNSRQQVDVDRGPHVVLFIELVFYSVLTALDLAPHGPLSPVTEKPPTTPRTCPPGVVEPELPTLIKFGIAVSDAAGSHAESVVVPMRSRMTLAPYMTGL